MPVEGYDHVAITVADVQSTIDFYARVLAAELCYADRWHSGEMPVAIIQLGGCRMSIHPAAAPAKPHALAPTPGSADLCFRWRGPIADAVAALEGNGVAIVEGPVGRPASNGERGQSVYFRDPDENLIELLTVD
jgi:catechol 2,3-dioxygenase-like lactoylglutathione lyase family enzyme